MGVQARSGRSANKDEESLPLTSNDEGFKDHHPRREALGRWLRIATCSTALFYVLVSLAQTSNLDFPWPGKPDPTPAPLPSFVKDGMKQCEIIKRPPPSHKHATGERKVSDRFVEGTKAVWLRNATVWTGEQGGEEVLYETDVLLDGGVVRKIGSSDEIRDLVKGKDKDVEEVHVNGAWLTPGTSAPLGENTSRSLDRYHRHALPPGCGLCPASLRRRRHKLPQSTYPSLAPIIRRLQHP